MMSQMSQYAMLTDEERLPTIFLKIRTSFAKLFDTRREYTFKNPKLQQLYKHILSCSG